MRKSIFAAFLIVIASDALFGQRVPRLLESGRVTLAGQIPPAATRGMDRGPVDPGMTVHYVSLIFNKTPQQQADFDRLLAAQRDRRSVDYVHWLTPAQYADRFGLDAASINNVRTWLESQGFTIDAQATSRTWVAFSGTAAQMDNAFGTELHQIEVGGQTHFAPTRDPSLPASLAAVTLLIRGLDDFRAKRFGESTPALANSNGQNSLTPDDLAAIYGITPLYAAGLDGTGISLAIVGRSAINLDDINAYQSLFGLPVKNPQIIAVADPGIPEATTAEGEAVLDLEVSGAIARGANQIYIYADDVTDAVTYAIDNAVAPIISMSFGQCENNETSAQATAWASLAQEAASKGITWLVSSGDSGPATCDQQGIVGQVAEHGIYVSLFAASPDVTAVGGTEFNEASTGLASSFWNSANGPYGGSATGYIPETAWNDSILTGSVLATGGGKSKFFSKPSWQVGSGVPNDGGRDLPDVAFAASAAHDGYYLCNNGCGGGHGGTSAAAPLFAGMVAVLNQSLLKAGVLHTPGLGNINPMLYQLVQSYPAAFHDIQTGSNTVSCLAGSPDCTTGSYGYPAGPGYDLTTGLGSVNVSELYTAWTAATNSMLKPSCAIANVTSSSTAQLVVVTVSGGQSCQTAGSITSAPSGTVVLTAGATIVGSASLTPGTTSSTATFNIYNAQFPLGTIEVVALYTGNSEYLPSVSAPQTISLSGASSAKPAVQVFVSPDPVHQSPTAYGNAWNFTLTLREVNGVAANLAGFQVNGMDATAAIPAWFGTSKLEAFGTISVPLQLSPPSPSASFQGMTLSALNAYGSGFGIAAPTSPLPTVLLPLLSTPAALTFEIDLPGPTATAALIASTFTAPLVGRADAASLVLSAVPSAVVNNPTAGSSCQWTQQLLLQEVAGASVALQQFHAGTTDLSSQISSLWGATSIAGGTALTATMCWGGVNAPMLINYEIEGTDTNGNTVSAAVTSSFLNQLASPNTLSVTQTNPKLTGALNLNTAGGSLVFQILTTNSTQAWTATVLASGQSPAWLTVYPASGYGAGSAIIQPAAGLAQGTYQATLVFQSADAQPQTVSFPVTFTVQ